MQEKLLRENVSVFVGTPGRVLDLNKSGKMNLADVSFFVIDEADRMFDMGFYPDERRLLKVLPPIERRQTMLFSATLNARVKNLAWECTKKPFEIEIKPEIVTVEEVTQMLYHVPSQEKMPLLLGIIKRHQPESLIIFCNTKKYTEIIARRLQMNGIECQFIIGDLPQSKRLKVIDDLKEGKIKTLVATDVAARGLDIENLAMVINYDLPAEAENYVHRIGRTARAGKTGKAVSLASEQDVYELPAIERYIGKKIPSEIAVQELYEEDKSTGKRINSDSYEGRRPRSSPKPAAGNRRADESRNVTKQRGEKTHNRSGNRSKERYASTSEYLSRLPIEDRMALYRKKYATQTKHGKIEHIKKDDKRSHIKKSANKITSIVKKERRHTSKPVNETQKPAEQSAPVKKGIFSKVKGLFTKK
jgi:ATP-dependent RNA helicase RhlB